jgi:anhydro-N-acetylmuramic acid kinase
MTLFIGLMSGTSMDAIDAALLDFSTPAPGLISSYVHPIETQLRDRLLTLIGGESIDIHTYGSLDVLLGKAFAEAANRLLQQNNLRPEEIHAIGSHGQTVHHASDGDPPFTLQIGDPNRIAQETGITTVADFRRRDMAAGGQGAPLAPAFHNAVFRSPERNRVILNIGGIANVTVLPVDQNRPVIGFDTGPGNCLLDSWAQQHLGQPLDRDGQWAEGGKVNESLLKTLLQDDYFRLPPPKSTGREYFNLRRIAEHLSQDNAENIQTTLCYLTVESVARAIEQHAAETNELYVCGGGAFNPVLMQGLRQRLKEIKVATTAELGTPPEWVEAAAFAWLAKQTLEHKAGNLPSVTGAREPVILGAIHPGQKPL